MQTMQTAVDDFEQALEPLVHARSLAEWDAAIDATDAHEQQLVEASKRVDAVLAERERYAQLVEADRGGGRRRAVRPPRAPGAPGERGLAARSRPGRSHHRGGGPAGLAVLAPPRQAAAGATSTTTRSRRSCASRPTATSGARPGTPRSRSARSAAPLVRELAHLRNEAARALGYRDHFVFSLTLDELDEIWLLALLDDLDGRLVGDLGAHQGVRSTRHSASASASPPARRCSPGTTPTRSSRTCRRPVTIRSRRRSGTSIRSRSRAPTSARSATTSTACSSAATSTRATARTSTRSAPTSTGATTCACSRTASRARAGWGRWCTSSGMRSTTSRSTRELPWLLRQPAHTFTTEAIAMLHGRLVRDETFLERFAGVAPEIARDPRNLEMQRREMLIFAAWVQVMTRFERELYRDPDQDLGALWWQLVERYQRVAPPPGAQARRLGLQDPRRAGAGLLPQLPARRDHGLAARLGARARDGLAEPGRRAGGRRASILRERFMRPGASLRWDALIAHATGEPLSRRSSRRLARPRC